MDEDDDSAGLAHQMELEQRQQEEEALARGRQVLTEFRRTNAQYDNDMKALDTSIRRMT